MNFLSLQRRLPFFDPPIFVVLAAASAPAVSVAPRFSLDRCSDSEDAVVQSLPRGVAGPICEFVDVQEGHAPYNAKGELDVCFILKIQPPTACFLYI